MTKIGDIIRLKRIEVGISQKELASQIGVDVSFLYKVKKNEKKITLDKLILISKELNIDIDEFKILFYTSKISHLLKDENTELKLKVIDKKNYE